MTPAVLANQSSAFQSQSYLNAAWTVVTNTGLIILNKKSGYAGEYIYVAMSIGGGPGNDSALK